MVYAYVDGSYNADTNEYGYGVYMPGVGSHGGLFCGNGKCKEGGRNVEGEVAAANFVLDLCEKRGITDVEIVYDYDGIGQWGDKKWKTNKSYTRAYADRVDKFRSDYGGNVIFTHVKGHTGNPGNEVADALAKEGCGMEDKKSKAKCIEARSEFLSTNLDYFTKVVSDFAIRCNDALKNNDYEGMSILTDHIGVHHDDYNAFLETAGNIDVNDVFGKEEGSIYSMSMNSVKKNVDGIMNRVEAHWKEHGNDKMVDAINRARIGSPEKDLKTNGVDVVSAKTEYVLVSQGVEIARMTDKDQAFSIVKKENEKWQKAAMDALARLEVPVDNKIWCYEETAGDFPKDVTEDAMNYEPEKSSAKVIKRDGTDVKFEESKSQSVNSADRRKYRQNGFGQEAQTSKRLDIDGNPLKVEKSGRGSEDIVNYGDENEDDDKIPYFQ